MVKAVSSAAVRRAATERPAPVNKRSAMLQAAAKLFATRGYDGTSMRDIAELVHVQPASLYHHFPSKSHILVSIFEESAIEMVDRVEKAVVGIEDPWEALEVACTAHMKALLAVTDDVVVTIWRGNESKNDCDATDPGEIIGDGIVDQRIALQKNPYWLLCADCQFSCIDRALSSNRNRNNHARK
jgi:AcrR family transcriptional regulator